MKDSVEGQLHAAATLQSCTTENVLIKTYTPMYSLGKLVMKLNTNQQEQSRTKIGKSCISNRNNSKRGLGSWNEACRSSKISFYANSGCFS